MRMACPLVALHDKEYALRTAASGGSCAGFAAKNAPAGRRQIKTNIPKR